MLVLACALACIFATGCKWKKKKAPPTAPSISTATTEAAALTGVPVNALPQAPPPVDPLSPADHALIDQTTEAVRDLDALVKKGVVTDPAKPEAGDVTTRCTSVEGARPRLETLSSDANAATPTPTVR